MSPYGCSGQKKRDVSRLQGLISPYSACSIRAGPIHRESRALPSQDWMIGRSWPEGGFDEGIGLWTIPERKHVESSGTRRGGGGGEKPAALEGTGGC